MINVIFPLFFSLSFLFVAVIFIYDLTKSKYDKIMNSFFAGCMLFCSFYLFTFIVFYNPPPKEITNIKKYQTDREVIIYLDEYEKTLIIGDRYVVSRFNDITNVWVYDSLNIFKNPIEELRRFEVLPEDKH